MAPKRVKKEEFSHAGWVNIYFNEREKRHICSKHFASKEEALAGKRDIDGYVYERTAKMQWND